LRSAERGTGITTERERKRREREREREREKEAVPDEHVGRQ